MLCCTCSRKQYRFDEAIAMPEGGGLVELASKELSTKILEGEAKLEEGSFEEAEITLREALSINNEVCPSSAHIVFTGLTNVDLLHRTPNPYKGT